MGFNVPSNNQILRHQPVSPQVWTRQPDWVSITGVPEGEVYFLVSDATDGYYTIRMSVTGSGNAYIDWGDGSSVETIPAGATNADFIHAYTSGGTPCSLGYNTWKISITSDVGARITTARNVFYDGNYIEYPSGLLEAWYGDTTITTANNLFYEVVTPNPPFTYLEYVKLPSGLTATDSLSNTFNLCYNLKKVDMPTSCPSNQSLGFTFYECNSLLEVSDFPQDMTGITTCEQLFYNCYSLQKVVYPSTLPNCTTISRMHQNNYNLGECNLPQLPSCTTFTLAFLNCAALKSVVIPKFPSSGLVTMTQTFNGCQALVNVSLPNDTPSTTSIQIDSTFNNCYSLEKVIFPPNVKLSGSMASTFNVCSALLYVSLPIDATSVTSFNSTFGGCNSLQTITLPSIAPSAAVTFDSIFINCYSLDEITIPSGYTITSLSQAFRTCRSVKSITLPNNAQNSLTTMAQMCDACSKLTNIVMPTSMTALTTLSTAFQACYSLQSVVFPSSLSSLTSFSQAFNNCRSLQSVTLPTTVGNVAATSANMFSNCYRIKEITMPTTYGGITSLSSTFNNCYSLKNITFGTNQLTGISTMQNAFNGCMALTGITNSNYLGNNSTSTTTYVNGTTMASNTRSLQSLSFSCKFSKLELQGSGVDNDKSALTSLRLLNNGSGQYAGTSPQINVSYTSMDATALNQLFTDLPTVTAKTISVVGTPGAATCNTSIATAKGWTVTTA